jgi:hypothetical protein
VLSLDVPAFVEVRPTHIFTHKSGGSSRPNDSAPPEGAIRALKNSSYFRNYDEKSYGVIRNSGPCFEVGYL